MEIQKAYCQGIKCWQTGPFRLFLRRLANASCLRIWLGIKHNARHGLFNFAFFFFHVKKSAIACMAQIDFKAIIQGAGQYGIHSAQSYVSYWVVIHFVTPEYNSGMRLPKNAALHFSLKQIKKWEEYRAYIVRLGERKKGPWKLSGMVSKLHVLQKPPTLHFPMR